MYWTPSTSKHHDTILKYYVPATGSRMSRWHSDLTVLNVRKSLLRIPSSVRIRSYVLPVTWMDSPRQLQHSSTPFPVPGNCLQMAIIYQSTMILPLWSSVIQLTPWSVAAVGVMGDVGVAPAAEGAVDLHGSTLWKTFTKKAMVSITIFNGKTHYIYK